MTINRTALSNMAEISNPAKKMKMTHWTRDELWKTSREDLVEMILRLQSEVEAYSTRPTKDPGLDELREIVEKLRQQVTESARQESLLVQRLAAKEHELQEMMAKNQEIKQSLNPSTTQLQSLLLDPAVNLMFQHMKQELEGARSKLEQAQGELSAWKFTPDSQTGKRLMAKCRMLLQENEELSKAVSMGKIAKLEGDVALEKKLVLEMKKSETDTEEFLAEMDEDMEAMQGTVYLLQQELREAKEKLGQYELPQQHPLPSDNTAPRAASTPHNVVPPRVVPVSNACLNGGAAALETRLPTAMTKGSADRGGGGGSAPPLPPQVVTSSSLSDGEGGGSSPRTLVQSADSTDAAVGRTRGSESKSGQQQQPDAAAAKRGGVDVADSVDQSGIGPMDVTDCIERRRGAEEMEQKLRCRTGNAVVKEEAIMDSGYETVVGSSAAIARPHCDQYRTAATCGGGETGSAAATDGLVNGVVSRQSGTAVTVDRGPGDLDD